MELMFKGTDILPFKAVGKNGIARFKDGYGLRRPGLKPPLCFSIVCSAPKRELSYQIEKANPAGSGKKACIAPC